MTALSLGGRFGFFRVRGPDAAAYLQGFLTCDAVGLEPGIVRKAAVLDRTSRFRADLRIARVPEDGSFLVMTRRERRDETLSLFDSFLFAENATLEADDGNRRLVPDTDAKAGIRWELGGRPWILETGEGDPRDAELDALLFFSGEPVFGTDFDAEHMALEVFDFEERLSFTKGCFPGQEIAARTRTQGETRKRLVGLRVARDESWTPPPLRSPLLLQGRTAGEWRSARYHPGEKCWYAYAFLLRECLYAGWTFPFQCGGAELTAVVTVPPFADARRPSARALLEKARDAFHRDRFEDASARFREALRLDPASAEAAEGLALSAERRGDLDDALHWNRRFAELDGNAVMARTNLSRIYMKKGLIDQAEKEQAKATALGFRHAAAEKAAGRASSLTQEAAGPENAEDEDAARRAETERRRLLFTRALAADAEDDIALFGLGKLLLDEGNAEAAAVHLRALLAVQPDHSQGHLLLGEALLAAGDTAEAKKVLAAGVAVAEKLGEWMPLKKMQERLRAAPAG